MEKAKHFARLEEGVWVWDNNELFDRQGVLLAHVTAGVLTIGQIRLLLENTAGTMRFRMRATSPSGSFGVIRQVGLTVMHLAAECAGRSYLLDRTSFVRKERRITLADGSLAATVLPQLNGCVEVHDGPSYARMPIIDAVFLSWGCVLVDAPRRRTRI